MNTKHLILFMIIALLAIKCNANVILPRQEDQKDPEPTQDTKPDPEPSPNPEPSPSPSPSPEPSPEPSPDPSTNTNPNPNPAPVQTTPAPAPATTQPVAQPTQEAQVKPESQVPTAPSATQPVTQGTITPTNLPGDKKEEGGFPYMWVGIGGAAVVVALVAIVVIKNKSNKEEDFNFTTQPTTYNQTTNYQNEPQYEQGYATPVNGGYDQYGTQDQYAQDQYAAPQDQYGNQGYDQYNGQDQYQYGNQGYEQYPAQDQYANNQGYDQTYPQPADDGQVIPGNQYTIKYDFKPSLNDEIELEPGNIVEVIEVYDDGWAKGRNLTYNTEGVFPVNRITGVDDSKKARYSSLPRPTQ
jgi:hypothetical protein